MASKGYGETLLAQDGSQGVWEAERQKVEELMEEFRADVEESFGGQATVSVRDWFSDTKEYRRAVYFVRPDGTDIKAFVFAVPITGYPVRLLVRQRVVEAGDRGELKGRLMDLMRDPDVRAAAHFAVGR